MRGFLIRSIMTIVSMPAAFFCAADEESLNIVSMHNFADGIHSWTYSDGPEVSMSWDPDDGSPQPGSLRLSSARPLSNPKAFEAFGPCMEAGPGERWRIEAMVRRTGNTNGNCVVYLIEYEGRHCTGVRTFIGNVPFIEPDEWHRDLGGFWSLPTTRAIRPSALVRVPAFNKNTTCHFDSVMVSNNRAPAPTDVPILNPVGILSLITVLAVAAFVLLARRSLS